MVRPPSEEHDLALGDQEAFCREAYPRLVRALDLYCGDRHLAEELAQEALLRACRRWSRVSGFESPIGWAYRVGVNLANSWFRRRRAERRARAHLQSRSRQPAHEEVAAGSADAVAVRDALGDLTDKQRAAVVLRYFLDLDTHETARQLDTTPGAVRALTHRAIATLRDQLDVNPDDEAREATDVS